MHGNALRRAFAASVGASLLLSLMATGAAAPRVALATIPSQTQIIWEGCRGDTTSYVTTGVPDTKYICGDDEYTSGNLGKGWNELDLVPHRLTTQVGTQSSATTDFDLRITGDSVSGDAVGYDYISVPLKNAAKSAASCTVTAGALQGAGSALIHRQLHIHQDKGTTCVFDVDYRLALGAAKYPGSSLHAHTYNEFGESAGVGSRDVSIPVREILGQTLEKDMTATRNASQVWSVTKSPTPATISFADTCSETGARSVPVSIKIEWAKVRVDASGQVTIITHVYATNPARRTLTVDVTDRIYQGATQAVQVDQASSGAVDIPANTANFLVLTHTSTLTDASASFNDVATGSYTDKDTGIPIPQTATAAASATVQTGTTYNASATITDTESMTGAGLTFSVAAPAVGAFTGGYTAGTATTGPVGWSSGTQTADGSVTFAKTVYVTSATATTGTLTDTATLVGSDGFTTSASASVTVSSSLSTHITVTKTIPDVLTGMETAAFTFDLKTGGASGTIVDTKVITFSAGQTSKTATFDGLLAGTTYTLVERPDAGGKWAAQPSQDITVNPVPGNLASCGASATIHNGFDPASARVQKVTLPAGSEAGWSFTLNGPGTPAGGETVTTSGAGYVFFATALAEGSYTITETGKPAWDQTSSSAECAFTVDYPADADRVFSCAYTNTQRGTIIVEKQTIPDGSSATFGFTGDAAGTIADNGQIVVTNLVPGTYTSAEAVKAGWDLTGIACDDGASLTPSTVSLATRTATFKLDPGETVKCVFTNRQRGNVDLVKTFKGGPIPVGESFEFQLRSGASAMSNGSVVSTLTVNSTTVFPAHLATNIVPGTYQVCEYVKVGYDSTIRTMPGAFVPGSSASPSTTDNSYVCVPVTVAAGGTTTITINNAPPPGGMAKTIGFWKNHAACKASNGNQADVLGQTLAKFPIAVGQTTHGFYVGTLYVDTCAEAVALLNKTTLAGTKMASDPAFNFAAQFVAYKLNIQAGAYSSTTAAAAAANGQAILSAISFNGMTHLTISAANALLLNADAGVLDKYNNNKL